MNQMPLFETHRLTVTEFTRRVRRLLEGDKALQDVWVQGEISNFSRPASGHLYFTLKDAGASLRCVMWKGDAQRARGIPLADGLSVEAHGKIGLYEPSGQYQLIVDILRPAGEGALYAEFMRLKAMLEAEGLFDPARKRPIPQFPHKIGIVTSATGAALRDMLNVLRRRLPLVEVLLAPSLVQGEEAPSALVSALQKLNTLYQPDVILLARGGGSIEDLWAFNDERTCGLWQVRRPRSLPASDTRPTLPWWILPPICALPPPPLLLNWRPPSPSTTWPILCNPAWRGWMKSSRVKSRSGGRA